MQLAVGRVTSDHFEETVRLDDLVANEEQGWRSMTKGDWQRIEDAGGPPDLCITARDKHGEDGVKYAIPGGGDDRLHPNTVITSYEAVIRELTDARVVDVPRHAASSTRARLGLSAGLQTVRAYHGGDGHRAEELSSTARTTSKGFTCTASTAPQGEVEG